MRVGYQQAERYATIGEHVTQNSSEFAGLYRLL